MSNVIVHCNDSGPLLDRSAAMPVFPGLRVLNLSNNLLSGAIPEALQSSGMFQLVRPAALGCRDGQLH